VAARVVGNIAHGKLEWTGTTKEIISQSKGAIVELTAMASIVNLLAIAQRSQEHPISSFEPLGLFHWTINFLLPYYSRLKTVLSNR
jgi:hypothetical protein